MAGAGLLGIQPCDFQCLLCALHLWMQRAAGLDPWLDVPGRKQLGQQYGLAQRLRLYAGTAYELVERIALRAQVALGGDLLCRGQVKASLRLARVGDGGGAEHKAALGGGQLLGDRLLARTRGDDRVLRRQHVEIGLRHAHDQILLGYLQLGQRGLQAVPRLGDSRVVGTVEQWLESVDGQLLSVLDLARKTGGNVDSARGAARKGQIGPHQRIALRRPVRCRLGQGSRAEVCGVEATCGFVHLGQTLTVCRAGQCQYHHADQPAGLHRGRHGRQVSDSWAATRQRLILARNEAPDRGHIAARRIP